MNLIVITPTTNGCILTMNNPYINVHDMWSKPEDPKCSFCGTLKSKARSMIKSNISDHHICDKCIKQGAKVAQEVVEK